MGVKDLKAWLVARRGTEGQKPRAPENLQNIHEILHQNKKKYFFEKFSIFSAAFLLKFSTIRNNKYKNGSGVRPPTPEKKNVKIIYLFITSSFTL